jgi:hypothetical protein
MKLDNKSDYSINFTRKALNTISKHADLNKPEEVRIFLAMLKTSNGYKRNLAIAYNKYAKYYQIRWEMPKYKQEAKNIALPSARASKVFTSITASNSNMVDMHH